jgi:hypothetical protein
MNKTNEHEIVFFFGAGASVKAGVPDTFGLVSEFKETIATNQSDLEAIEKILETLTEFRQKLGEREPRVDVEVLLETLERLETKDQDILLQFHTISSYALSGYADKKPLKDKLKDFIKKTGIVDAGKVRYLEPLITFFDEFRPLDIFSVNYDTAIEQFCSVYRKDYVDGFDLHWNSKAFGREDVDIRLYKLHGSILWYKTDRGDYVKLPIKTEESTTELVTGEKAVTLMVYPIGKWEYAEPFLELLLKLKEMLESAKIAIIVGYSFRDDYIKRLFWDAARRNKNLVVILISPSSKEIYEQRLKNYEIPELPHGFSSDFATNAFDAYFPSSLSGRVLCLPYRFEDVLPLLRNQYLKSLREGILEEKQAKEQENRGERGNWWSCFRNYLNCEFVGKMNEIASKVDWKSMYRDFWTTVVNTYFQALFSCLALSEDIEAKEWIDRINDVMERFSVQNIRVEVTAQTVKLAFASDDGSILLLSQLAKVFSDVLTGMKQKPIPAEEKVRKKIEAIDAKISGVMGYMRIWKDQGILIEEYIQLRQDTYKSMVDLLKTELSAPEVTRQYETLRNIIRETEQKELEKIFEGQSFKLELGKVQ